MVDVMVLSVLSMQVGDGDSRFPIPIHRWAELIERGLQKEQDYQKKISELEAAIASTRDGMKKAELAALLAREKEQMAKDAAARARAEAEKARERESQSVAAARKAEIEARSSEAEKSLVAQDAARARARKEKALALALEAEKRAAAAIERSNLAQEELERKLKRIAEIKTREAEILKKARQAEFRARQAENHADDMEERMAQARKDIERAAAKEREYAELMAQAREKEAEIRGRAVVIEGALKEAKETIEEKNADVVELSGKVVGLAHSEKEARRELGRVAEEKVELAAELNEIKKDEQSSIWIRRDESMLRLRIYMIEKDIRSEDDVKDKTLYLPLLDMGGEMVIVSEFNTLELDWWEIQVDLNVVKVLYAISDPAGEGQPESGRARSLLYRKDEPRVIYLPFSDVQGEAKGLSVIGMQKLKKERIQDALLFKPTDPDRHLRVKVTPLLRENYLSVKNTENKPDLKIRAGDYILTERGRFVGVMVTRDKCFVLPLKLPDSGKSGTIPLIKNPGQSYYRSFVEEARNLKKRIKELKKDSFWF